MLGLQAQLHTRGDHIHMVLEENVLCEKVLGPVSVVDVLFPPPSSVNSS